MSKMNFLTASCLIFACFSFASGEVREAVATLHTLTGSLGTVTFRQEGPGLPVTVTGILSNLTPPSAWHGLHVHERGNISSPDCMSAKAHWNPHWTIHGNISSTTRHIGDLGNVKADHSGFAHINLQLPADQLPLVGPDSIVGRSLVIHQGEDDMGAGGHSDSTTTGHAGARLGCGVIGLMTEFSPATLDPEMQQKKGSPSSGEKAKSEKFEKGEKAIAVLRSSTGNQEFGTISFVRESGNPSMVHIFGTLHGISPKNAEHGFHVHQFGNVNCTAAGNHYNPDGFSHAGMHDAVRHVGDLGNIFVNGDGTANVNIRIDATKFPLVGPKSIIGRTLVLHDGEDDLGLGNFTDSKTTGHAGGRLGCGVIGIDSNFSVTNSFNTFGTDVTGSAQPSPYGSLLLIFVNLVMIAVTSGIACFSIHI